MNDDSYFSANGFNGELETIPGGESTPPDLPYEMAASGLPADFTFLIIAAMTFIILAAVAVYTLREPIDRIGMPLERQFATITSIRDIPAHTTIYQTGMNHGHGADNMDMTTQLMSLHHAEPSQRVGVKLSDGRTGVIEGCAPRYNVDQPVDVSFVSGRRTGRMYIKGLNT